MPEKRGRNIRARDGQWHYRFNFRGREYSGLTGLSADDSNRTAAEEFARKKREELAGKKPAAVMAPKAVAIDPGFQEAGDAFVSWCRDVEYRSKPGTAERLRVSFVALGMFFGATPVRKIDAAAIEEFKAHRAKVCKVRDVTIRHDLHALSVFFRKFARPRKWIRENPLEEVRIPSDRDAVREHVVTPEEEAKYFAAAADLHAYYRKSFETAQPNLADLARLMLEQGARPEELLAARVSAFDVAAKTLRIEGGKTRAARRTLYLTPASCEILERRAKLASEWLFPSDRHPGRHITQLRCTHDRVCREAGVSFCLYDWRHTFATRAVLRGVPVAVVAAILGHSSLRTIHRYVHPSAEAQAEAMGHDVRRVG